jgi:hypothetical protein
MKKLLVVLSCFAYISVNAQTADEVIQKYSAAMGGLDAINKITSAKFTGTLTTQGMELPLMIQIINGKAMRTDLEVNGKSVNNVYNNGKGWTLNPYAGATTAREVTGAELLPLKVQASLANNLMDYKSRGHLVELLGQEDVEGKKTFKLKLTNKDDGKVTTYFINTADYLLVKSIAKRDIAGSEYDAETYYTEIKEINGVKFLMHFTQKIEGQVFQDVKYQKIELNVPVDEKIFVMPG